MSKKDTTETFVAKAIRVHGDILDFSKVQYIDNKTKVLVCCPIHGYFWMQPNNILSGQSCPKCKIAKLRRGNFLGVGINDSFDDLKSPAYKYWKSMLTRCYNNRYQKIRPTYKGCEVDDRWKTFSVFKKWFDENYVEGYELEKDILVKGNKIYGPDTCCFVPSRINHLILNRKRFRGPYPIGVSKVKGKDYYDAYLTIDGNPRRIGRFLTPEAAFACYKNAKEKRIKEIAREYYDKGLITRKVYNALQNYSISITD